MTTFQTSDGSGEALTKRLCVEHEGQTYILAFPGNQVTSLLIMQQQAILYNAQIYSIFLKVLFFIPNLLGIFARSLLFTDFNNI